MYLLQLSIVDDLALQMLLSLFSHQSLKYSDYILTHHFSPFLSIF